MNIVRGKLEKFSLSISLATISKVTIFRLCINSFTRICVYIYVIIKITIMHASSYNLLVRLRTLDVVINSFQSMCMHEIGYLSGE